MTRGTRPGGPKPGGPKPPDPRPPNESPPPLPPDVLRRLAAMIRPHLIAAAEAHESITA
jgi:hypothetical protein